MIIKIKDLFHDTHGLLMTLDSGHTLRHVHPGKTVAAVRVERGCAVHHRWHNNSRTYYVRANDQTREASSEELQLLFQRRGTLRAELGPVSGAGLDTLDLFRLEDYFERVRGQAAPARVDSEGWQRLLLNTEMMTEGEAVPIATLAGMLLFGKETQRYLPQSGIDAVCYHRENKVYDSKERAYLRGPMTALGPAARIAEQTWWNKRWTLQKGTSTKVRL